MPITTLNFITSNKNKLTEVSAILGDIVHLTSQSLDLTEIQGTIEDVSRDKCRRAAAIVRACCFFFWVFPNCVLDVSELVMRSEIFGVQGADSVGWGER